MAAATPTMSCGCSITTSAEHAIVCSICSVSQCENCFEDGGRPADVFVADDGTRHVLREASPMFNSCSVCSLCFCSGCQQVIDCDRCMESWCQADWPGEVCSWCALPLCNKCADQVGDFKTCAMCARTTCGEHIDFNYCEACSQHFCIQCQPTPFLDCASEGSSYCPACAATKPKCAMCSACACPRCSAHNLGDIDGCATCRVVPAPDAPPEKPRSDPTP